MSKPRAVALGVLLGLLIVDLAATSNGYFDWISGGDCGGKSCVVHRPERGVAVAVALVIAIVLVIAWRRLTSRVREDLADFRSLRREMKNGR